MNSQEYFCRTHLETVSYIYYRIATHTRQIDHTIRFIGPGNALLNPLWAYFFNLLLKSKSAMHGNLSTPCDNTVTKRVLYIPDRANHVEQQQ